MTTTVSEALQRPLPNRRALKGKKGVCFTLREPGQKGSWKDNIPKVEAIRPYWNYSWGRTLAPTQPAWSDFIPMIWGYYPKRFAETLKDIRDLPGERSFVLAFNEPDGKKQSNVKCETAIEVWPEIQKLKCSGYDLVSPACVNALGDWMKLFMQEIDKKGYTVDVIGVHFYRNTNLKNIQTYLQAW